MQIHGYFGDGLPLQITVKYILFGLHRKLNYIYME